MAKTTKAASPKNAENDAKKAEAEAVAAKAAEKAAKAPKEKKPAKQTVIRFVREPNAEAKEKVGGQAGLILAKIRDAGENGITRKDLIASLDEKTLATRQSVDRVVSFYQRKLVDMGLISVSKEEAPAAAAGE